LAEAALLLLSATLGFFSSPSLKIKGALLAIVVSAFVFWKTVIYVWYDYTFLTVPALNFSPESIVFYYFPNSFWLVCPIWVILGVSGRLGAALTKEKTA